MRESAGTLVFSEKFSCLKCGTSMPELEPRIFSFNSPHGACPRCTGLGSQMEIDPDLAVDPSLTINEGAILPWSSGADYYEQLAQAIGEKYEIDLDVPWEDMSQEDQDLFLYGDEGERVYVSYRNRMGRRRSYMAPLRGRGHEPRAPLSGDRLGVLAREDRGVHVRAAVPGVPRRAPAARDAWPSQVGGLGIHEFTRKSAREAIKWLDALKLSETERQIASRILKEIVERLQFLDAVGVGYLTLERAAATLSGGEAQRIRLATQIGSSLVGVLYILDEPSIGLHQRDNHKLLDMLKRLRDLGNTVIVVEHDEGTMRAADHIVDLGPGAGEHGGQIVAEGSPREGRSGCRSR